PRPEPPPDRPPAPLPPPPCEATAPPPPPRLPPPAPPDPDLPCAPGSPPAGAAAMPRSLKNRSRWLNANQPRPAKTITNREMTTCLISDMRLRQIAAMQPY